MLGKHYNHDPRHFRFERQMKSHEGLERIPSRWKDCAIVLLAFVAAVVISVIS